MSRAEAMHPVLDMHTHPLMSGFWSQPAVDYVRGVNPTVAARSQEFDDPLFFRDWLRGEGVDHAVVLAEEAPLTSGMITSEMVLDFVRGVDGLHCFVCPNPYLDRNLEARLDRLLAYGPVEGIKLLPSYQQFYPTDPTLYPLYARAQDLGLPVTFHTGTSRFPGTRLKYADPLLLDDVAVDFPHLVILLAHSGRGSWYGEAAMLAALHENVYLEISGLPPRNLPRYFPDLDRLVPKMVFGSDFPGLPSVGDNIAALRELLGDEGARRVLWENGARLLGLETAAGGTSA